MNTLTCYSILSKLTYGGITTHYRCHLRQCDTRQQGSDIFNWLESQLGANSSVCPGSVCRFYTAVAYLPSLPHADYPSHGWLLSLLSFSHELPIECPSRLVCNTFLLSSSVHNNNFKKVSLTKYSHVIHIHTITTLTLQPPPPPRNEYQIISAHTHTHTHTPARKFCSIVILQLVWTHSDPEQPLMFILLIVNATWIFLMLFRTNIVTEVISERIHTFLILKKCFTELLFSFALVCKLWYARLFEVFIVSFFIIMFVLSIIRCCQWVQTKMNA